MPLVDPAEDRRQQFLDMLTGRLAPAPPGPPASAPPAAEDSPGTDTGEAPPAPPTSPAAPLSYEREQPPAEEVPAAMAALASDEAAPTPAPAPAPGEPDLMNLGYDAQLQGTALSLHSVGQRLQLISEGLKLIPALANIGQHLEQLNYPEVAAALDAIAQWAASEEKALYQTLEERRQRRTGETPSGGDGA